MTEGRAVIQVEVFADGGISSIERATNDFLEMLDPVDIIDIKYATYGSTEDVGFTTMVIYKKWLEAKP